jgi:spore coat polysaccharide biosynthesis protein SpsF
MSNTVAIIQARLGSNRLRGKVLTDLAGQPMIHWVVRRVQRAKTINQVIIATTDQPHDRPLVDYCKLLGWPVFAGPEHDVLTRYLQAAELFSATEIVRITSDCPLIDPALIDDVVNLFKQSNDIDYCCNFFPNRTFPRGLDAECLSLEALQKADTLAATSELREHVTLAIYRNPARFRIASVTSHQDFSDLRWTVDTKDDLELIRAILTAFRDDRFSWQDVVHAYHQHPGWHHINSHVRQRAG